MAMQVRQMSHMKQLQPVQLYNSWQIHYTHATAETSYDCMWY